MKIGIFAGTFDPIHNGHIAFAKESIRQAGLEKVIIVAEKDPYRKKPHTSWDHRQAMIERATQSLEQVDHDYQFAAELAHQHTMQNMLEVAKKHYGEDSEFWFLVGSDIYEHMHQWKGLVKDHEYGGFIVALRKDHTKAWLVEKQSEAVKQGIAGEAIVIDNQHSHISSSQVRDKAKNRQVSTDVDKAVVEYIERHQLYL